MEGHPGFVILEVYGREVQALAGTGSNNFISARFAEQAGLLTTMDEWEMPVWNMAVGKVRNVPVQMEGRKGLLDFVVIVAEGIDMVLGREGLLEVIGEVADPEEVVMSTKDDGDSMEQDRGTDCMTNDVAEMTIGGDELEMDQVEPQSSRQHTCVSEGTPIERPHDHNADDSYGLSADRPCARKGKNSLPERWRTVPWVTMMKYSVGAEGGKGGLPKTKDSRPWRCKGEPCVKKQNLTVITELGKSTCDFTVRSTRARDKGGT